MLNKFGWVLIIIFSLLLFSPSLANFFFGDDWFHIQISQINNINQFYSFFSFYQTPQSATFYRPISTQVFHFIFGSFFGLNPIPYRIFILLLFALDLLLLYKLLVIITHKVKQSLIALLIYGISATHFVKIYYLAATQEIIMLFFGLLSTILYLKNKSILNKLFCIIFFILALLSRETAVVFPALFFLLDWGKKEINLKKLAPFLFIVILYLILRLGIFGGTIGESYVWDFSIKSSLNTLAWYSLWSLGAPELLVDYISSGVNIIPRFYSDFPAYSYVILLSVILTAVSFFIVLIRNFRDIGRNIISYFGIFLIGILPVIFLPWHKFALELTISLIGFSLFFSALLIKERIKIISIITLCLFILLNLETNFINYKTNYSIKRADLSREVFNYFTLNYAQPPLDSYFEFVNDTPNYGKSWGSSKQIADATSQSNMFKVMYKNPDYRIFFEDIPASKPLKSRRIAISTAMFLNK
jgi:hypothetical protein